MPDAGPTEAALKASLRRKALQWLAQRERSPQELAQRLAQHADRLERAPTTAIAGVHGCDHTTHLTKPDPPGDTSPLADRRAVIEQLLAELVEAGYLCAERFTESRVRTLAAGHGNNFIAYELKRHGLAVGGTAQQELAATELERARELLQRRFPERPLQAERRQRAGRFLAGRGFGFDTIARALREAADVGDASAEPDLA